MKIVLRLIVCTLSFHLWGQGSNNFRYVAPNNLDSLELQQMSNRDLIVAALNSPFLVLVSAFNSPQMGYKAAASYSPTKNPIAELTSVNKTTNFRQTGTDLLNYYKTMDLESDSQNQDHHFKYGVSPYHFIQIFLATPQVYGQLSENQQRELLRETIKRYDAAKSAAHHSLVPGSAILLMARILNANSIYEFVMYKNTKTIKVNQLLDDTGVMVDRALYPDIRQMAVTWSGYVANNLNVKSPSK